GRIAGAMGKADNRTPDCPAPSPDRIFPGIRRGDPPRIGLGHESRGDDRGGPVLGSPDGSCSGPAAGYYFILANRPDLGACPCAPDPRHEKSSPDSIAALTASSLYKYLTLLKLCSHFIGKIEISGDVLYIVVVFQRFDQTHEFLSRLKIGD